MAASARRGLPLSLLLCGALLSTATPTLARQATGAVLEGTVRDTIGAVLPGCTVTAAGIGTRTQASVVTDDAGRYAFADLPSGEYRVTASLSGFRDSSASVKVAAGQHASLDFALSLGEFSEQVTVTALKRGEERLGDVPIAVTAVQSTRIDELGAGSFQQVAALAPGASLVEYAPGQNKTQIRGLSASAGDPLVGYYLDETPWAMLMGLQIPDTSVFDLDRLEVLRGPQGTLYGDNAMGGVLRFITAQPDLRSVQAKANVSSSSYSGGEPGYVLNGALSVPIVKDKLAVRAALSYRKLGGWIDSTVLGPDINDAEYGSYRLKALWRPTPAFKVTGTAWISRADSDAPNSTLDDLTTNVPFPQPFTHKYDIYSVVAQYDTPKLSVLSATSNSNAIWDRIEGTLWGADTIVPFGSQFKDFVWSEELRLSARLTSSLRMTAGTMFRRVDQPVRFTTAGMTSADQLMTSRSWAAFGELSYTAGRVDVTAGLRQFGDTRRVDDYTRGTKVPDGRFSATTPRFNVGFHASKNSLVYVNVAKGFRSGLTLNPFQVQTAQQFGVTIPDSVLPEHAWTYEGGVKTTLAGNRVSIEAAGYLTDYGNMQTWLPIGPTPVTAAWNVGSAKIPGLDWSIGANPVNGLSLAFSGNWNGAHYAETVEANGTVAVSEGQRVVYVPETSFVFSARYSRPVGRSGWLGFCDISTQHVSSIYANATGADLKTDGFNNAQLRVGVENRRLEVTLFVENLTNNREPTMPPGFANSPWWTRLPPRSVGIDFRVRY
jgi:outer membrane receptor protein involved in Fe transport